ncbi:MAG: hypothetical protein HY077_18835 [Elusimicrobia bacterium]|nr:hypothetical protein [Elusimicrobiota bacterium]
MRILGEETEEKLHALESARGWKRSGLIAPEQLAPIEAALGPLPVQGGWAVRLLLFGFVLSARAAFNTFFTWSFFGRSVWDGSGRLDLAAYYLLSAPVLYLVGEFAARRWRLYRFGVEEGLMAGALINLWTGLALQFLGSSSWDLEHKSLVIAGPLALACAWLYARAGYAWAAFGAAAALAIAVLGRFTGWTENGVRLLACGLFAAMLAASFLRRATSAHDRFGWQALQATLFLMGCLVLNVKLEHAFDISWTPARGGGNFYWWSFFMIFFLPSLALGWAVPRRHRSMLAAGFMAALVGVVSVKPYLGLARHAWDPAVLGLSLMCLSIYLRRWLDAGPDGQRGGWTAKPLIVGRNDGPDMMSLVAAATAASAGGAGPAPEQKGFTGQGGSSGGAGAGGSF